MSEVDSWIEILLSNSPLNESQLKTLCEKVSEILKDEPNVLRISSPITICGSIYGQFYDLKEIFKIGGTPPYTNYIFLGNFVNNGFYSIETISLLLCLKLRFPKRIFLIRGAEETKNRSYSGGFYDECLIKYPSSNIWKILNNVFDILPLSAIIDNNIFCVHSGLSISLETIDEINQINRFCEIPDEGPINELIYNYPEECKGWGRFPKGNCPLFFGSDITENFQRINNLSLICRCEKYGYYKKGYNYFHNNNFVSIISAPNFRYYDWDYEWRYQRNLGAIMELDENGERKILQFRQNDYQGEKTTERVLDYFN